MKFKIAFITWILTSNSGLCSEQQSSIVTDYERQGRIPSSFHGDQGFSNEIVSWLASCEQRIKLSGFTKDLLQGRTVGCKINLNDVAQVDTAQIVRSGGSKIADDAAIALIRRAGPFKTCWAVYNKPPWKKHLLVKLEFPYVVIKPIIKHGEMPDLGMNAVFENDVRKEAARAMFPYK